MGHKYVAYTNSARYKSTSNIRTVPIGSASFPDDDELSSYGYYGKLKQHKPTAKTITQQQTSTNALTRIFSKGRLYAPHSYNRWLIPPAALAVHMSIGSVYAWSIFNSPLTRELGVVVSSSGILLKLFQSIVCVFV